MNELKVIVRTADKSRKAEIVIPAECAVGEIIDSAIQNWSLPSDTDYTIVNATRGTALNPTQPMGRSGILEGDTLEIQPVLTAGRA
jgi:hypothetical protein